VNHIAYPLVDIIITDCAVEG